MDKIAVFKGQNHLRILLILLLTLLLFFGIYIFPHTIFSSISLILVCLGSMLCVQFPEITVYNDRFNVQWRGMITKFSSVDSFYFTEIEQVTFRKGYSGLTQSMTISLLFGGGPYGSISEPDLFVVVKKDGSRFLLKRIGKEKDFIQLIQLLQQLIAQAQEVH
ncbi:MAG: hypothetical protein CFE24_03985 [Flavobacterium sp. BFFFF2]|nr:MAG: hypothetical protein CFE24_03985 [Flavobacterium sp. BFFFF2]